MFPIAGHCEGVYTVCYQPGIFLFNRCIPLECIRNAAVNVHASVMGFSPSVK